MVFSSLPIYLDPPNWNQVQTTNQPTNSIIVHGDPQQIHSSEAVMASAIRPGSMAERARLAKVPQPDQALKCPRCDSINTKFCYFNNYSLSQPRHFCKTCRRYWTRGGALRNVPVGGGCRRNKRSKSSGGSSKISASASSSSSTVTGGSGVPSRMMPPPQPPLMSLHPFSDYTAGLNFSGTQSNDHVDYQTIGSSSIGLEQWRFEQIQQFPLFGGLDPQQPAPVFPFNPQVGGDGFNTPVVPKASCPSLISQFSSVKMEDTPHSLDFARQFLGVQGNDQYWSGGGVANSGSSSGGWAINISGFNSASSGNFL